MVFPHQVEDDHEVDKGGDNVNPQIVQLLLNLQDKLQVQLQQEHTQNFLRNAFFRGGGGMYIFLYARTHETSPQNRGSSSSQFGSNKHCPQIWTKMFERRLGEERAAVLTTDRIG